MNEPIAYGSGHEGVAVLLPVAKPGNKTATPLWPDQYAYL